MVLFNVQDYFDILDRFRICRNCLLKSGKRFRLNGTNSSAFKVISIDSIELNRFWLDLRIFPLYRSWIANLIVNFCGSDQHRLVVKIHPPLKEPLDYAGGARANQIIWEHIELDEMMSWLSTLGGAFSALGDYKLACADVAGRISIQQMKLALRLGEPSVIERCRLYMSIAMIQKYDFVGAKNIVKRIYRKEKRKKEPDTRLIKMCLGIWSKLTYEYDLYQKKLNRPKE